MTPPLTTHRQQQALPIEMIGSADSTPMTTPPMSAGWTNGFLVVVLTSKMRDELFALEIAQRVLELHQLDEQIVLRVHLGRVHRRLVVERQPLLDAVHLRPLREIQEERRVEDNRRGEDAVAAEEVDLQLHRIAEPAEDVDVVPALFVVAARRVVVDPNDVREILVEIWVEGGLEDVVERAFLALFL